MPQYSSEYRTYIHSVNSYQFRIQYSTVVQKIFICEHIFTQSLLTEFGLQYARACLPSRQPYTVNRLNTLSYTVGKDNDLIPNASVCSTSISSSRWLKLGLIMPRLG